MFGEAVADVCSVLGFRGAASAAVGEKRADAACGERMGGL